MDCNRNLSDPPFKDGNVRFATVVKYAVTFVEKPQLKTIVN